MTQTTFPFGADPDDRAAPLEAPPPDNRRRVAVAAAVAAAAVVLLLGAYLLLGGSGDTTTAGPVAGAGRRPAAVPTVRAPGTPARPSPAVASPANVVARDPFRPLYIPAAPVPSALTSGPAGTSTTTGAGTTTGSTTTGAGTTTGSTTTGAGTTTGTTTTTGGAGGAAAPAAPVVGDPNFTG